MLPKKKADLGRVPDPAQLPQMTLDAAGEDKREIHGRQMIAIEAVAVATDEAGNLQTIAAESETTGATLLERVGAIAAAAQRLKKLTL